MAGSPPLVKLLAGLVALGACLALLVSWQSSGSAPLTREAYAERLIDVVQGWPAAPASADAVGLRTLAEGMQERADEIGGVRPPREIAAEHDRLVAGLRAHAAALTVAADAVPQGPVAVSAAVQRSTTAGAEWAAALQAIADRGYMTVAR